MFSSCVFNSKLHKNQLLHIALTVSKGFFGFYHSMTSVICTSDIQLPSGPSLHHKIKKNFPAVAGLLYILGVISCIHESIITPANEEEIYRNRKHS